MGFFVESCYELNLCWYSLEFWIDVIFYYEGRV